MKKSVCIRTNCLKSGAQLTSKWCAYQICFRQWKISNKTLMTSTTSHLTKKFFASHLHLSTVARYLSNEQEKLRERPLYISQISVISCIILLYLYTFETGEFWIICSGQKCVLQTRKYRTGIINNLRTAG